LVNHQWRMKKNPTDGSFTLSQNFEEFKGL